MIALVLVDLINAFFDPRGSNYYPRVDDVKEPLTVLLSAARSSPSPCLVVHAREAHRPALTDFEFVKLPVHCVEGEFDALPYPAFVEQPGEPVVLKRRYSAFFATDLALLLREQGVSQVVVAGVKTNVCVRATVQDAFAHGFRPVVVRSAVSSNRPHLHDASLEDIERYFGALVSVEEALELVRA